MSWEYVFNDFCHSQTQYWNQTKLRERENSLTDIIAGKIIIKMYSSLLTHHVYNGILCFLFVLYNKTKFSLVEGQWENKCKFKMSSTL